MQHHILVVDDDDGIRELLGRFLQEEGYLVSLAEDVASCERIMKDLAFDLLIIDVMMPNESGLDFIKRSRLSLKCPVIMLTALGDVDDRINGLSSGANDYLAKPFEPKELLLRLKNLLNYVAPVKAKTDVTFGKLYYDQNLCLLSREDGSPVSLTTNEQTLLQIMIDKAGQIISREEIAALFPGSNLRSTDTLVARLRSKIEDDSKNPVFLQTIRGQGYVFRR